MLKWLTLCGGVLYTSMAAHLTYGLPQEQGPPPARKIPGITSEDRYPHACVDCHINYVDMKLDTRISTMLKQWQQKVPAPLLAKAQASAPAGVALLGRHPLISNALDSIPATCLTCHSKASKTAPPFASIMHKIHLTGGEKNHFLTMFQGECTYCHKLDLSSGRLTNPSAPER